MAGGKAPLIALEARTQPVCAPASESARAGAVLAPLPDAEALFRRYAPYVAAIGIRILGRQGEIEDFVQDVFLGVHRHLGSLRDPGALKGWLAKLAVHQATRRLKRRKLRALFSFGATPTAGAARYEDAVDGAASPEDRTLLAHVFVALDELPARERVAWSLRYLGGETMESVAELCDCSLSTAKRRVAAAEQALAKRGVGRER
ncbi:MAG: polymerase sigma factor RpoE [Myxococcaceae bacterium]|nr:polymerase sigma factor RpoE [Myxococcaceae bacterium]